MVGVEVVVGVGVEVATMTIDYAGVPTSPPELLAQVQALRPHLGAEPVLYGLTASHNGIEWDDQGHAVVDDIEEFVACWSLPVTHARAAELVSEDRDGQFSDAWQDAVDEWTEDAKRERGYEAFLDWAGDHGIQPSV